MIKIKIQFILILGVISLIWPPNLLASDVHVAVIDSGATGFVNGGVSFTSLSADKDPLNHGTQVARLIRQGNPTVKIHMLQVCEKIDGEYKPSREAVLKAIRWAVQNSMDIVNVSLVLKYDSEIENAINDAATSHGILFVAAAGNRTLASHFAADHNGYIIRSSKLIRPAFPASNPYVIAVGGLDESGKIAEYSDKSCDIYEYGKILGQEGSSFACARVTSKITRKFTGFSKTAVLASLK